MDRQAIRRRMNLNENKWVDTKVSHKRAPNTSYSSSKDFHASPVRPAVGLEVKQASWTDQPPVHSHLQPVSARLCPGGGTGPPPPFPEKCMYQVCIPLSAAEDTSCTSVHNHKHQNQRDIWTLIKTAVIITTQIASPSTFPIKSLLYL